MRPGEWHNPLDSDMYRERGDTPLQVPPRCDEDELAARQAVDILAGDTPGMTAYPVYRSGYPVQAHIEGLPDGGSQTITGRTWRELLGKLTRMTRATRLPPFEPARCPRATHPPWLRAAAVERPRRSRAGGGLQCPHCPPPVRFHPDPRAGRLGEDKTAVAGQVPCNVFRWPDAPDQAPARDPSSSGKEEGPGGRPRRDTEMDP